MPLQTVLVQLQRLLQGNGLRIRLARAGSASIAIKTTAVLLGFIITIVLARNLGPTGYGIYAFAMAIVTIISLPAKAGLPQVVIRETAKALAASDWGTMKGVWHWATRLAIFISIFILIISLVVAVSTTTGAMDERTFTFILALGLVPLLALEAIRSASMRGLGHIVMGQLPEFLIQPGLLMILLLLVPILLWDGDLTPSTAMALTVAATGGSLIVGVYLLRRSRPVEMTSHRAIYQERTWLTAVVPLGAANALYLISTQIDILLIGTLMESENVGHYRVATQASLLVVFGLQATKMVVEPYFSRLYAQGDLIRLQKLATGVSQANLAIALLVTGILVVAGQSLLSMAFGKEFAVAYLPMMILCAGRLAAASIGSSGHLLTMAGYERVFFRFWVYAAAINIILNILLIPLFGTVGAASATATGLLVAYGLSWWGAKRLIGCDCSPIPQRYKSVE